MTQQDTSPAAPFLGLLARMPWWVGVALALAAFVALHEAGNQLAGGGTQLLVSVGQVLVPLLCLLVAALSAWQRRLAASSLLHAAALDSTAPLHMPAQTPDFEDTVPPCPLCHGAMVRRVHRLGPQAGQVFWRCLNHPVCSGQREAE
jgi:restriction system protein